VIVPPSLADRIEDLLPQTQCTKCGYNGCRPYAQAVAEGRAGYNQCPPGGTQGIARLAALLGKPVIALNPANGVERPRPLAVIDENLCIGCTLCMQACPVDAIVGAPKQMHTVLAELCTGCDLCVAPCPVDCIAMIPITGEATGWDAWTQAQADAARERHARRAARLARERDAAEQRAAARLASVGAGAGASVGASAGVDAARSGIARAVGAATQTTECATAGGAAPVATGTEDGASGVASGATGESEARKRTIIQAALERARKKKEELAAHGVGPKNVSNVSPAVQAQIDAAQARRQRLGLHAAERASGTPASGTPASGTPASGTPTSGTPEAGTPETDGTAQVAAKGDASGNTQATPDDNEAPPRPGNAGA
jgi:electron transport complex protein RnfB